MKKLVKITLVIFAVFALCGCSKDNDDAHQKYFSIDGIKYDISYAYQFQDMDGFTSVVFMEKEQTDVQNNVVMISFFGQSEIVTGSKVDVVYDAVGAGLLTVKSFNWSQYDPQNPGLLLSKAFRCTKGTIEIKKTGAHYRFYGKKLSVKPDNGDEVDFELVYEGTIEQ